MAYGRTGAWDGGGGGSDPEGEDFAEVGCPAPAAGDGAAAAAPSTVVAGAAGWGHTALVVDDGGFGRGRGGRSTRLLVAGRPHDFQTLLRLRRLPSFLRGHLVRNSLRYDDGTASHWEARGAVARLIDVFLSAGASKEREGGGQQRDDDGDGFRMRYGVYPSLTEIELPGGDRPAAASSSSGSAGGGHSTLAASAGLTAVIGESGTLYAFGLNHRGQCGVGERDSNNVWDPTPVAGLSMRPVEEEGGNDHDDDDDGDDRDVVTEEDGRIRTIRKSKKKKKRGRAALAQDRPIMSVRLGLQHGLALDDAGQLYSWGKGARGQLGVPDPGEVSPRVLPETEYSAVPVTDFCASLGMYDLVGGGSSSPSTPVVEGGGGGLLRPRREQLLTGDDARVTAIGAGMNHSAAITASNQAWVWGKNVIPRDPDAERGGGDSPLPVPVPGLPPNLAVLDVACGSHHTSFLLEDGSVYAVGVATDTVQPVWGGAVELIPPGIVDMPPRQFAAHFDRTTVVGRDGRQVLEVQLWSHEELRDGAAFEPGWVDGLLEVGGGGVRMVHRGWMHTVVVTDD